MADLESIIVLDGSARSRGALAVGFERAGFSVYATDQAAAALTMAATHVSQLFIVGTEEPFSDRRDPFEVIERLRGGAGTQKLAIVMVGGEVEAERARA